MFKSCRQNLSWNILLREALAASTHHNSPIHGQLHWRAVAQAGISIAADGGCAKVALAFAMIHDCQRINDEWDPDHGERAAVWASKSRTLLHLVGKERRALVSEACLNHEKGYTTQNPVIGSCWDADRINLWRVGLMPLEDFFSVLSGLRFLEMRNFYQEGWRDPASWEDLIRKVQ